MVNHACFLIYYSFATADKHNGQSMANLKDVAKEAGVSIATVSYVLNGTGSVSKTVANRVLRTVEKLGYKPNRAAQTMKTGLTKTIGLMLPDLTNPFFPELAQKIGEYAQEEGFALILIDCQNDPKREEKGVQVLVQHNVDGVLWCPLSEKMPKSIDKLGGKVVILDRPIKNTKYDSVRSNHVRCGEIIADYLVQLGHRSVGLVLGPEEISGQPERAQGFLDHAKGKLSVSWTSHLSFSMKLDDHTIRLLEDDLPSALVAGSDVIGIALISHLNRDQKQVPNKVSIIGYDDIPWAEMVSPALTTVRQPISQIAKEAVSLLLMKLDNPEQPSRQVLLDVLLKERQSTISVSE